jgi:aspartyl-tRNA(Asn)/glutamyl-tRNA(Gln) amidotransferase subunit B
LEDDYITTVQATVPMLPPEYRAKWTGLSVDSSVINSLLNTKQFADAVTEIQQQAGDAVAKRVANWFASAVGDAEDETAEARAYTTNVGDLMTLAEMTEKAEISSSAAKEIFNDLLNGSVDPRSIAESKNLLQVSDEGAIAAIVDEVLADPASAASIADIKAGKDKAIGYLVGQIMKKSQGKANPALAQKLIRERL